MVQNIEIKYLGGGGGGSEKCIFFRYDEIVDIFGVIIKLDYFLCRL